MIWNKVQGIAKTQELVLVTFDGRDEISREVIGHTTMGTARVRLGRGTKVHEMQALIGTVEVEAESHFRGHAPRTLAVGETFTFPYGAINCGAQSRGWTCPSGVFENAPEVTCEKCLARRH